MRLSHLFLFVLFTINLLGVPMTAQSQESNHQRRLGQLSEMRLQMGLEFDTPVDARFTRQIKGQWVYSKVVQGEDNQLHMIWGPMGQEVSQIGPGWEAIEYIGMLSDGTPVYAGLGTDGLGYVVTGHRIGPGCPMIMDRAARFEGPKLVNDNVVYTCRLSTEDQDFRAAVYFNDQVGPVGISPPDMIGLDITGQPVYAVPEEGDRVRVYDRGGFHSSQHTCSDVYAWQGGDHHGCYKGLFLYTCKDVDGTGQDMVVWGSEERLYDWATEPLEVFKISEPYLFVEKSEGAVILWKMNESPSADKIDRNVLFRQDGTIEYTRHCSSEEQRVVFGQEPDCPR